LDIKEQQLATTVNFLDLTLTIKDNRLVSKTYQKTMNLYLYIPFASSHSQGCIKCIIYGLFNIYFAQNTNRKDYVHFVGLLYRHICLRGWDLDFISSLLIEASTHIEAKATVPPQLQQPTATTGTKINDEIYIHSQYHPDDITRRELRSIYDENFDTHFKSTLGIKRAIVAYSRPKETT